ncbi:MAG: hypothetical protein DMG39_23850 [Acidobacteria bacterium]|nr:MAG: hypothetical protein DMG39_23850 [Acidobacteriota bacterium]
MEFIFQGREAENAVALFCLALDAQTLLNVRICVRCCLSEPHGSSFLRFANLDKAILASGELKLLKLFHGDFSLRSFSGVGRDTSLRFRAGYGRPARRAQKSQA